jgi:hypothetical protein
MALSGVNSLGLRTTVQPTPRAANSLSASWFIGQFQGVMIPTTPTGSRKTLSPDSSVSTQSKFSRAAI